MWQWSGGGGIRNGVGDYDQINAVRQGLAPQLPDRPGVGAGLVRLAEASGDRRGRLAQPRLGARQLVLGAVLP